jgi:HNH endonuclease
MLSPRPPVSRYHASNAIPELWESLALFWDEDRIKKWYKTTFTDPENPDIGVERCFNLISLSPDAHDMWNQGMFALKPLSLSRNRKKLIVQIFLQAPGNYKVNSRIDLLTEPTSSEGLEVVGDGYALHRIENDGSSWRIRSGETLTFTTKDPKKLPLPNVELLEMQWFLQRLVGMCGAAGWPSLDDDGDDDLVDDDDGWLIPDYSNGNSLKRVREWVGAEEATGITPETLGPSLIQCH